MKKKIYIALASVSLLFSAYYYWQNKYVQLRPIIALEYDRQIIFFDNSYFRFAKPNEVPPNFYKHLKFVLNRSNIDYIEENGIIYVRNKFFNDMELAWNFTNRASSVEFFKMERETDSINGDTERLKELDNIIKDFKPK